MDHQSAVDQNLTERYLLDELDGAQREEFEEHFFECPVCAADLRSGSCFVENLKAVCQAEPATAKVVEMRAARGRPSWLARTWIPAAAAAGFAAVIAWQNLLIIPNLRHAAEPQSLIAAALRPVSRGEDQVVELRSGDRFFVLVLDVNAPGPFSEFECEFRDAFGAGVLKMTAPAAGTSVNLLAPAARFSPGSYVLLLRGKSTGSPSFAELEQYRFTIQKR